MYDNFDAIDSAFYYMTCIFLDMYPYSSVFDKRHSFYEDGGFLVSAKDDGKPRRWRRLDNRLNSFYGSTYECPLGDYEAHEEAYRFVICGDKNTMSDSSVGCVDYVVNPLDEPISYADRGWDRDVANSWHHDAPAIGFDSLEDIILSSYPNSVVTKIGNFSLPVDNYTLSTSSISQVYSILTNIVGGVDIKDVDVDIYRKQLPTHIAIGGIEKEISDLGDFDTVITTLLNTLEVCRLWGIRTVIITDPCYKEASFYPRYRRFIDTSIPDDCLIDIDKWITVRRDGRYSVLDDSICFYDFIYNYITDKTIEKWQLPVHRDKYYVSLISDTITDSSYDDFMKNSDVGHYSDRRGYVSSLSHKLSRNKRESDIVWQTLPYVEQYHINKYGTGNQSPNLFMNTGHRFVVIVHTGYSDTLYANEQFQANTNYEFLCQTDACGENYTGRNLINTLPVRRPLSNGSENPVYTSTVYPGTGAPWFVMSDKNAQDYSLYTDAYGAKHVLFDCWITLPDDKNCSITIKTNGNHELLDNWQSVSFGRFPYKQSENYSYSLYCAGGSLGISNDVYVYVPNGGGAKTYVHGNSYDLDFCNICWSHSATLLKPTKFNGANTSNFRVLSIEGIWKNIYSAVQTANVYPYPSAGLPPDFASILSAPIGINSQDHLVYPTYIGNASDLASSKYINTHGYTNLLSRNYVHDSYELYNTQFIPISIFFDSHKDHYESCECATIPKVFCTYDKDIASGEFTAQDGHTYLIVPCGWEGRLYGYDYDNSSVTGHRFKVLNEPWEACDVVELYEANTFINTNNYVMEKLAIRID